MKIYLIADTLTHSALDCEEDLDIEYNSNLWKNLIRRVSGVDFLLVESAWQGYRNSWKYKIASYPDVPSRNNRSLKKLVMSARNRGIPTVFWNKEDSVHFDRFVDSAGLFDYIFTVDENAIPRYHHALGADKIVNTLMFAVQPKFHYFKGFEFKYNKANFVGSYSRHIHCARREWQDIAFQVAAAKMGLMVIDRNSNRKAACYRYPAYDGLSIYPAVQYNQTAQIYRDYLVSLNVNTVTDSATMFSRRLPEILACGGIAVTNSSRSVDLLFRDYCYVADTAEEMLDLLSRLQYGPETIDLERARAAAATIAEKHTWGCRLQEIYKILGL